METCGATIYWYCCHCKQHLSQNLVLCNLHLSVTFFFFFFPSFISLFYRTRFPTDVNKCDFTEVNGCKSIYTIPKSKIFREEICHVLNYKHCFLKCVKFLFDSFYACFIFLHISFLFFSSPLLFYVTRKKKKNTVKINGWKSAVSLFSRSQFSLLA